MFSLVYVSSATRLFTPEELRELLKVSRSNNTALGISGMLLYKAGNFIQVLEGDEAVVQSVYGKIARDPRHRGCLVLIRQHQARRNFEQWSMGFVNVDNADTRSLPGYDEFMNVSFLDRRFAADPSQAHKLLLSFRQTMSSCSD